MEGDTEDKALGRDSGRETEIGSERQRLTEREKENETGENRHHRADLDKEIDIKT